jgi:hypothetical protein
LGGGAPQLRHIPEAAAPLCPTWVAGGAVAVAGDKAASGGTAGADTLVVGVHVESCGGDSNSGSCEELRGCRAAGGVRGAAGRTGIEAAREQRGFTWHALHTPDAVAATAVGVAADPVAGVGGGAALDVGGAALQGRGGAGQPWCGGGGCRPPLPSGRRGWRAQARRMDARSTITS